jgi:hypothetical protein
LRPRSSFTGLNRCTLFLAAMCTVLPRFNNKEKKYCGWSVFVFYMRQPRLILLITDLYFMLECFYNFNTYTLSNADNICPVHIYRPVNSVLCSQTGSRLIYQIQQNRCPTPFEHWRQRRSILQNDEISQY